MRTVCGDLQRDENDPPKINPGDVASFFDINPLDPLNPNYERIVTIVNVFFHFYSREWYAQCLFDDGRIFTIWSPDLHLTRIGP